MQLGRWVRALACSVPLIFGSAVLADESPASGDDYLTGDWAGRRLDWSAAGVTIDASYRADMLHNARGGLHRGTQTMWQLEARIAADLDKLLGLPGTTAYLQVLNDRGGRINERNTGSVMGVSNIEVPTAATHLFHAWVQKSVLDDRLAALIGLYPVDSEFSTLDSAGWLLHPSFGASADFSPTRGPSIFPISAFGTRLRWQSEQRSVYVQGALLDGVPGNPDTQKGTHIEFNSGDGSFGIAEIGYKPGDAAADDKARALADPFSKVAAGVWRYTARVPDLVDVDAAGNPVSRKSWGYYLLAEQTLYRPVADASQGLAAFARFSSTDGDSTPIRYALNIGLNLQGPISSRPDDVAVIGFTRGRFGSKFRHAMQDAGTLVADAESVLELVYRAQANEWLALQPGIQWIRHPSADSGLKDATVVGLRVDVAL